MVFGSRASIATIATLILVAGCTTPPPPCPPPEIGSWTLEGEPEIYIGDDLFIYINGGAEIYHEYGFIQIAVQRYRRGENTISVEIYTMDGDAFGVYSFARSPTGRNVDLGEGGTAADYYVHVWSGSELAVITAEDEFDDLGAAVMEIATVIAGCLPPGGAEPDLLLELPSDVRGSGGKIYFRGRLALMNVARPAASLFSGFADGVAASLDSGESAVVLRWSDEAAAVEALEKAQQTCSAEGGTVNHDVESGAVELATGRHRISAIRSENLITLHLHREAP